MNLFDYTMSTRPKQRQKRNSEKRLDFRNTGQRQILCGKIDLCGNVIVSFAQFRCKEKNISKLF